MSRGGVLPPETSAERVEVVHAGARSHVTRVFVPGGSVIRKELRGVQAPTRLRREAAMLEWLRGVTGVAQLLDLPSYPGSLVLEDLGGASLARLAMPLPVELAIRVAVGLARAVAAMHRRGVLHRDITPANVVISADGAPVLVDFALATFSAETRPEFSHPTRIAGTLAYLAPELAGRTSRVVDQRADLYALGATLYELATGAPPFGAGDPLRLAHDHLARVPVPPAQVNPAVPPALSAIVLHLLQKEPDNRYQTAEGLLHDLERLPTRRGGSPVEFSPPGAGDRPPQLRPPARLAGRDEARAALESAFEDAMDGRCRGVMIVGAAGVGKTALANELRPVVARRDGWFVSGKFDQDRHDLESNGVHQVYRALGRLLLAEPEQELAEDRERILAQPEANPDLMGAAIPEFASVLGIPASAGDPLTAQLRAERAGVAVLRAVASRRRPLVLWIDDLQWAGRTALEFVDAVLSEEPPFEGLLLVGAVRQDDGAEEYRGALGTRWRNRAGVRQLRLDSLPVPHLVGMVAAMLRVDAAEAAALVELITPYTSGNPSRTVELLNALRGEGLLTSVGAGWQWDSAAVRDRLDASDVAGLLAARIQGLPEGSRRVVEAMACLGGRVELGLLRTATAAPAPVVKQALVPPLSQGLLAAELGGEAVRFRHDGVREVVLAGLAPERRHTVQLAMARRLAEAPELFAASAGQYLPVLDAIRDAGERTAVVGLLRRAATRATLAGDHAQTQALLAGALELISPEDTSTLLEVRTQRHAAQYNTGQLDAADAEFGELVRLCPNVEARVEATRVQLRSLTQRNRLAEALDLGLGALRALGMAVPDRDRVAKELDSRFELLHRWLEETEEPAEPAPAVTLEPIEVAVTRLSQTVLPVAYFVADLDTYAWLALESVRIWLERGPGRSLLGPASTAAWMVVALRGDYVAGYRALRRMMAFGEAHGYEPETSEVRYHSAMVACWFEPVDSCIVAARRARDGLLAGGELQLAGCAYHAGAYYLLDRAPSLDRFLAELQSGLAFARRTGGEQVLQYLDSYRWLASVLRGDSPVAAGAGVLTDTSVNPLALLVGHITRAIAAAIFSDSTGLAKHSAAAMPLLKFATGAYLSAQALVMRGLSLAEQLRAGHPEGRGALLAELDEVLRWLAARAKDAPMNYLHLLRLVEAERAHADGDFRGALLTFDAARRAAASSQRPWHQALIAESAARFYLAHGIEHAGLELLGQAREHYRAWGAEAKVAQLAWAYAVPQPPPEAVERRSGDAHDRAGEGGPVTAGTLDLLGVLSASRALSSHTSIAGLHAQVVEVLGAMTGATGVRLLVWGEDRQEWLRLTPEGGVTSPGQQGHEVPLSVLRYVRRTGEPLVVGDATREVPFADDPYFAHLDCCSLLAVPVLSRGIASAALLLENRLIRGAFTVDRLDAVKLIAGQLAVSLDNAQLYSELTASRARIVAAADEARRRIERDLHDGAQQRLISLALRLRVVQVEAASEAGELAAQLDSMVGELTGMLEELRELARGIHPVVLVERGLYPALETLARRGAVPVELTVEVGGRLPDQVETAAYYVVSEALTNVARHARATIVHVEVDTTSHRGTDLLRVVVRDDGLGGAVYSGGTGLLGLKDRVEALGGRILLESPPGAGTTLRVELPVAAAPVAPPSGRNPSSGRNPAFR